jgi:hypothetical protein
MKISSKSTFKGKANFFWQERQNGKQQAFFLFLKAS